MERAFTPWRMEYILSDKQEGCVFCEMLGADCDRENLIVCRSDLAFVVLNKYPYNNGHFMVVPCRHVDTLEALTPAEMAELMRLTALGMRAVRETMRPDGFNFGANIGEAAGAGVKDHFHLHVVPRWNGDNNFMAVIGDVKLIPQTLAETRDLLEAGIGATSEGPPLRPDERPRR
jgi:ATP adenylyltransferase